MPTPVCIPATEVRTLSSISGDSQYQILIGKPGHIPPETKLPVIYLLDADACFNTMLESIRMRCHRPDATSVSPALVVGISHAAQDGTGRIGRTHDFTCGPSAENIAQGVQEPGGAAEFLHFIETRLKPVIEQDFPVDPKRQTLFGHSLGGYFVLTTALSSASTFQNYVAVSPSIWWNRPLLFKKAAEFFDREKSSSKISWQKQLILYTGEYEESLAPWQPANEINLKTLERRKRRAMVANAQSFTDFLIKQGTGFFDVHYQHVAGEDHASVVSVAINRSLRTVLAPE